MTAKEAPVGETDEPRAAHLIAETRPQIKPRSRHEYTTHVTETHESTIDVTTNSAPVLSGLVPKEQ